MKCSINRIGVPTDFSPYAASAQHLGAVFANHNDAELDLVTAVDTTGQYLAS